VDFDATYQPSIIYSSNTGEEMGIQGKSASAVDRLKEAYDSVRREVLYILIALGIPT
jgi:hypothetical protein